MGFKPIATERGNTGDAPNPFISCELRIFNYHYVQFAIRKEKVFVINHTI
jgi:hypothetical protein